MFEKIKNKIRDIQYKIDSNKYEVSGKGKCLIDYCIKILNRNPDYIEAYEEILAGIINNYIEHGILEKNTSMTDENTRFMAALKVIAFFLNYSNNEEKEEILDRIYDDDTVELVLRTRA